MTAVVSQMTHQNVATTLQGVNFAFEFKLCYFPNDKFSKFKFCLKGMSQ